MKTSQAAGEIRERLAAYLRGDIALREFADWVLSVAWNANEEKDPSAARLAYEIEILLFETSNGDRTEDELRQELSSLMVPEMGKSRG